MHLIRVMYLRRIKLYPCLRCSIHKSLKLNEGEFAFMNRRHKRNTLFEQRLAAQTALLMQVSHSINFAFRHNVHIACSHLDYMAHLLHLFRSLSPTLAARPSCTSLTSIHVIRPPNCCKRSTAQMAPFSVRKRDVPAEREAYLDSMSMIVSQHSRLTRYDP